MNVPLWIIIIVYPLALWTGIFWLITRLGGWSRLARLYPAPASPPTESLRLRAASASIGLSNYSNCLDIHVSKAGLRLAIWPWPLLMPFHRALQIPWSELEVGREKRVFGRHSIELIVGQPVQARLWISAKVLELADRIRHDQSQPVEPEYSR